ncbi:Golgi apparatus membrane protein tvp18 [Dispira parvispora]|uniref:Golgi apparatus membrane protein tvp18 n=1 Tax=Dispira parvispora TaxID=1520584 RepID=A0A9W8AV87_9FUNG|nr:Golgi apparatus membrane protein tvp18 [Dispira parvispora]
MGFKEEFLAGKFTVYAQWSALIAMILLIVLGAVTFFTHVIFSALAIAIGVLIIPLEIPIFLKICPTTPGFDKFVKVFDNAWLRFAAYLIFSGVIWASLTLNGGVLVVGAAFLTVTCLCYFVAALRKQERFTSAITGGTGVSTSPV